MVLSGENDMRSLVLVLVLTSFAMTAPASGAAAPDLVTDRPDFTESGVVVPRGSVQVEAGLTWEDGDDGVRSFAGPEALVRWGMSDEFELRFGLPDYVNLSNGVSESGLGDASLGAKLQLGPVGDWDLAGILTVSTPTGDDGFTSDGWDPQFILAAGRDLNARWSLGAQVSLESASTDEERVTFGGATLVLGSSLDDEGRTGAFLELAAILPESGTAPLTLHHGYTRLLSDTLQIDLHGGVGLSDTAPDAFVGAGVSFRR